ncbi:hypothetical protein KC686_03075 [Candidatus Woesebacteria bacterium]|nr:hypothetical protein [Candidatus Woesebacteria bacterium]
MKYMSSPTTTHEFHWKFYRQLAGDVFSSNNQGGFSYFAFSPDQYAYQAKYAMRYFSQEQNIQTLPFQKSAITYLMIAPNDNTNPWANEECWQKEQLKITKQPDLFWTYSTDQFESYSVKKFSLNQEEIENESDPNLVNGIQFR